ncbi:MFS transporter [Mannheimia sp. E30BD]|uniref:MFS transporter n=1 Tax=Mannheimia sp. E30BD TaxID=3278708 RepID=UPI00359EAB4B
MSLNSNGYTFKKHELPMVSGSPATPEHPSKRKLNYFLISLFLTFTAGLQNGLLMATLPQLRGDMGLTIEQGGWLQVAYFMGYGTFGALLFKVRQHFGLHKFIRWTLWVVLVSNLLQVFSHDFSVVLFARLMLGIGTSGFFTLAVFYGMQAVEGATRIIIIAVLLGLMQIVPTLSQLMYPLIFIDGDMQAIFIFQLSITLIGIGFIRWLPLPPSFKQQSLTWLDYLSFAMFAIGISFFYAFLTQGNLVWWTTSWLGWLVAGSFGLIALMFWIETHRQSPMIYWHWVSGKQVAMFMFVAMLTRLFSTEQTVGANTVLSLFGLSASELTVYNLIMWGAGLAGLALSIVTLKLTEIRRSMMIALFGLAIGAYLNIGVSQQTRAEQFYLSQAIIAFSSFYFAGPVFIEGFLRAIAAGIQHIISFLAIYSSTQVMGALLGSAMFSSYITIQSKVHLQNISQHITATDPAIMPQAVGNVIKNANIEATLLAYNDLFELIFLACGAFALIAFVVWIYRKIKGIDILAKEMKALQAMM